MSRTLFVNQQPANPYVGNGTIQNPFRTIREALTFAATLKPSVTNPVAIAIMQGTYAENVVISQDGIILRGLGGVGTVRIAPPTGSAVTITNCLPASVKTFVASRDSSVLQKNAAATLPVKVELVDLAIQGIDVTAPAVCVVGCPNDPPAPKPLGTRPHGIALSNCMVGHNDSVNGKALFAYYVDIFRARHNTEITAPTEVLNCLWFNTDDADIQDFVIDFDPSAAAAPPAAGQLGLVCNNTLFAGQTLEIRGSVGNEVQPVLNTAVGNLVVRENARFTMIGGSAYSVTTEGNARLTLKGIDVEDFVVARDTSKLSMIGGSLVQATTEGSATGNADNVHVRENLLVRGTSTLTMAGGNARNVTVEGGASWTADDVHVRGDVNVAAGPAPVTMNAGRIMGKKNDPTARLKRHLGE